MLQASKWNYNEEQELFMHKLGALIGAPNLYISNYYSLYQGERQIATTTKFTIDLSLGFHKDDSLTAISNSGAYGYGITWTYLILEAHVVNAGIEWTLSAYLITKQHGARLSHQVSGTSR